MHRIESLHTEKKEGRCKKKKPEAIRKGINKTVLVPRVCGTRECLLLEN